VGNAALDANTTGDANTAVGDNALGANTTASNNTAVGYQAGYSNTTGAQNTAVGSSALAANTTANNNTAVGYQTVYSNTTGASNTALGNRALYLNTTGSNNTAVGQEALNTSTASENNTAVGFQAGYRVTTGTANLFVGRLSGQDITTGSSNVIIGSYGGSAAPISATGSNFIVLSDGDGNVRQTINSSGNVGIGVTAPLDKLSVSAAGSAGVGGVISVCNSSSSAVGNESVIGFRSSSSFGTTFYSGKIRSVIVDSGNEYSDLAFNVYSGSASVERMRVNYLGIVTMSAYGAGTATFSAAGVISSVSDETWKIKDGAPVDTDSMLQKLEPGYWYYNDEKKESFGTDRQLGFYAQNVNAAIGPEAAPVPEEGKPWGYYDRSVLAVTVMSLQKALATIESLTSRIAALEAK
jgi:hypothetical protein